MKKERIESENVCRNRFCGVFKNKEKSSISKRKILLKKENDP